MSGNNYYTQLPEILEVESTDSFQFLFLGLACFVLSGLGVAMVWI